LLETAAVKLGLCSICLADRPLRDVAALAADVGLDGIEVTARRPHIERDAGPEGARAAAREVRETGVEIIAYGSYLGYPPLVSSVDVAREVAMTEALGTPLLRVWATPLPDAPGNVTPVVSLMRETAAAAAAGGITVVIERHAGSFADTAERAERLLDAIDRPNVALNYQPLDSLRQEQAVEQPDDCARLIGRSRYFHVKNYYPNADGGGLVTPFASIADGVLDYRSILRAAAAGGYDGPLSIEFLATDDRPAEEKLAQDAAFLRRIIAELGA
jgi:sugar phosphate isomerase/epimerase